MAGPCVLFASVSDPFLCVKNAVLAEIGHATYDSSQAGLGRNGLAIINGIFRLSWQYTQYITNLHRSTSQMQGLGDNKYHNIFNQIP